MSPPGFEPTIRASERPWTQGLDHTASWMRFSVNITHILIISFVDSRADKHHIECVCEQDPENGQEPKTMETAHGAGPSWGAQQPSAIGVKWETDQNIVCSVCNSGNSWSAAHRDCIPEWRWYLRFLHWCWYRLSLLRCYTVSSGA